MSWSINFHADEERKVTVEADWRGPGDYQLRRLDGAISLLGVCQTPEEMLNALLDSDWSVELEGARIEPVPA
ncbi:MAG TPA: hypothetical protein PLU26_15325 [Candidatus Competibacter sp.]|nr:hypothetical protein [Candidatus Competibacteraceae bacterium]HUM95826.1 hypothetical protein [Candidatus Competibacter sp.]